MDTLLTEIMVFLKNCGKIAYQEGRSCIHENITSGIWLAPTRSNRDYFQRADLVIAYLDRDPEVVALFFSTVGRESSSEHGPLAYRLFFGGFILNYVKMLDKDSVVNAQNICSNPIRRSTESAKSPMHDHDLSLSHDHSRFILQR